MQPLKPTKEKSFHFPWHLEATLILAMAIMAIVEARHGQWLWAIIFGLGSLAFITAAVARAFSGGNRDKP